MNSPTESTLDPPFGEIQEILCSFSFNNLYKNKKTNLRKNKEVKPL